MHSGACFNLRNIVGISSINQGEKKANTKTIGYKGIGFKTVFVNNEYVFLKSGDWSLRFDKNTLRNNSMVIVHGLLCLFQQIPLNWMRK